MARNFKVEAVHKQMYPATYNFRDEENGTNGTDIEFVDVATTGANTTLTIQKTSYGHNKIIQLSDSDGAARVLAQNNFSSAQTSGTIEFWWLATDVTKKCTVFGYSQAPAAAIQIFIDASKFQYNDGAPQDVGLAAVNNTWYHIKIIFDCTPDTYEIWIDGIQYQAAAGFTNVATTINNLTLRTDTGDSIYISQFDAIGYSWDTDYNIGDNCFWRHYKESDDPFESDDTGTQGTSITWVDSTLTAAAVEIVNEFNEHKKVLKQIESAGNDYSYHYMDSQAMDGWFECWVKSSDVTGQCYWQLREDATACVVLQIITSKFQYYDKDGAAYADIPNAPTPVNDQWYHIYIKWVNDTNDTYDLWIDNIKYLSDEKMWNNQTSGINRVIIREIGNNACYIDAAVCSLDSESPERGDNRTFDYNSTYTKSDITTDVINVHYTNKLYGWRTASLFSEKDYEQSEIFVQVYDINSALSMEAELINRIQEGKRRTYILLDKNYDDLHNRSSNTFAADKIHDPTDSTSILKVILPNVSEADGDLILVNADTKTDTYSPVTKNYPDFEMLRDISDLSDSVVIIEANGKCHLDDDLASGDSLDLDTAADKNIMIHEPKVNNILDTINYFEIFGAINPDTGTRFSKVTDNSGSDKKRKWRITNNQFRSQTDVDAYAAKLVSKLISVKEITIGTQGLGTHNMGETFNYKYVNEVFSITQADYYIIEEAMDFDLSVSTIVLSEGLIESSKYSATYEKPENYNDSFASEIYETDIITIHPRLVGWSGATDAYGYWNTNAVGEIVGCRFYIEDEIDDSRDITITFLYRREDANNDTVTITKTLQHALCDGTEDAWTSIWASVGDTLPADANNEFNKKIYTVSGSDVNGGHLYRIEITLQEIRIIDYYAVSIKYYLKRSLS